MSYEYRIIIDKKPSFIDLQLIYNNLKQCLFFNNVFMTEYGICMMDEKDEWELVGIGLIDEGFFITANINERELLLEIVESTMIKNGVKTIIEEE